jgi:hypothetical protein
MVRQAGRDRQVLFKYCAEEVRVAEGSGFGGFDGDRAQLNSADEVRC